MRLLCEWRYPQTWHIGLYSSLNFFSPLMLIQLFQFVIIFPVSDCQTLIKSYSVKSRNDPNPKSEVEHETKFYLRIFYSTHVWVADWNKHLTSNPLMAGVVFNSHWRQQFEGHLMCKFHILENNWQMQVMVGSYYFTIFSKNILIYKWNILQNMIVSIFI